MIVNSPARIYFRSLFTKTLIVIAFLVSVSAGAQASAIGVSYTVTGAPGAWVLNFSFTNNVPGQVLYFFGVNLPTQNVVSSPSGFVNCWFTGCSKTTINPSTDLAPVTTTLNETFNDLWHISQGGSPPFIVFGGTASGFKAGASTLLAPTSVDWLAFTADVTGTSPYLGNENFPYSGDCLTFAGVTFAVQSQENPIFSGTASPTPEPGTLVLLASGLISLGGAGRRRISKCAK